MQRIADKRFLGVIAMEDEHWLGYHFVWKLLRDSAPWQWIED
jgi:hypothetical protein